MSGLHNLCKKRCEILRKSGVRPQESRMKVKIIGDAYCGISVKIDKRNQCYGVLQAQAAAKGSKVISEPIAPKLPI